jgi:hypothetical protein
MMPISLDRACKSIGMARPAISLSKVPLHDWASHAADVFRTAAVMIHEPEKKREQEERRPDLS